MNSKKRNSNFELLRIISMLLIVFHHSVVHGLLIASASMNQGTPVSNQVWLTTFTGQLVAMFGKVAVAVFVMISGYFLVNSSFSWEKSLKKILFLVAQVYFYSLIIYSIATYFKWINFRDLNTVQQAFFPLFYNTYWFATEYLLLYLIYPFLNVMLHNINQRQHRDLILIIGITFTMLPTLIPSFGIYDSYGLLVVFILYYIIGGYIRLYSVRNEKCQGKLLTILGVILVISIIFYHDYMGRITHNQQWYHNSFMIAGQYSFTTVIIATGVILLFKNINLGQNKVINTIASTTFGVYLIHDNPIMEQVIWLKWLNMPALLTSGVKHFLITVIIVCPLIFTVCSLIDYIRIKIFDGVGFIFNRLKEKFKL